MADKLINFCRETAEILEEIDNCLKEGLYIKAHDKILDYKKQLDTYRKVLEKLLPEEERPDVEYKKPFKPFKPFKPYKPTRFGDIIRMRGGKQDGR